MRTFTCILSAALVFGAASLQAQTVATFDDLTLSSSDTFYLNLSAPGTNVGFNDGLAFFPCIYDTSFGSTVWNYFAYSNKTDSVTSGYTNEYAAKTAIGYGGSAKYAVVYCSNPTTYANTVTVKLTGAAIGRKVKGFYVTNSTYAFNSMRDGDSFAKKFGGSTGNDADWFLLTLKGYTGGALTTDSVNFYLADYRFAHNDSDYIVKTWDWVDLQSLGNIDSVQFHLSSSDNGSFGMNTPASFCIDNFTTLDPSVAVAATPVLQARVYPNPATDYLYADMSAAGVYEAAVVSITGQVVASSFATGSQIAINTASLPSGIYTLHIAGNGAVATTKFVKQ